MLFSTERDSLKDPMKSRDCVSKNEVIHEIQVMVGWGGVGWDRVGHEIQIMVVWDMKSKSWWGEVCFGGGGDIGGLPFGRHAWRFHFSSEGNITLSQNINTPLPVTTLLLRIPYESYCDVELETVGKVGLW